MYDPIRDRMILCGGATSFGETDSVWALTLDPSPAWSVIPALGSPGARTDPGAAYDPSGDRMVSTGDNFEGRDDTWALPLSGVPQWVQLNIPNPHPQPRGFAAYVDDFVDHDLIVFGGSEAGQGIDTINQSDSWALSLGDVPTPALPTIVSASVEDGIVRLQWLVAGAWDLSGTVYRNATGTWVPIGNATLGTEGHLTFEDRDVLANRRYGYRLGIADSQGEILGGETWVETTSRTTFALAGAVENPCHGHVTISYSLPDESPASLELFDAAGKRLITRTLRGAGDHIVDLGVSGPLASGIYFARLSRGTSFLVKKVCVVP